jgi:hypothetical protein
MPDKPVQRTVHSMVRFQLLGLMREADCSRGLSILQRGGRALHAVDGNYLKTLYFPVLPLAFWKSNNKVESRLRCKRREPPSQERPFHTR